MILPDDPPCCWSLVLGIHRGLPLKESSAPLLVGTGGGWVTTEQGLTLLLVG